MESPVLYFMVVTKNYSTWTDFLTCKGRCIFHLGESFFFQWMKCIDWWVWETSSWDESEVSNYTQSLMKIWRGKTGDCVRPKYVRTRFFTSRSVIREALRTAGIILTAGSIYDKCSISTAGGRQVWGRPTTYLQTYVTFYVLLNKSLDLHDTAVKPLEYRV